MTDSNKNIPLWGSVKEARCQEKLRSALSPLLETPISYLKLPIETAGQLEPSQIGTTVGTLTDMMLPSLAMGKGIGLTKAAGLLGDREGYPDFEHESGYRLELKGVFTDNPAIGLKKPPTPREPSARITQKVTVKNVDPDRDALLLLVYQLQALPDDPKLISPTIVGIGIFPVIECINARDARMLQAGGRWFGDYETPTILSHAGKQAIKRGDQLNEDTYGRKESEGHHFNEDTNFGKLKRIPYLPLQRFLKESGCQYSATGTYPSNWRL